MTTMTQSSEIKVRFSKVSVLDAFEKIFFIFSLLDCSRFIQLHPITLIHSMNQTEYEITQRLLITLRHACNLLCSELALAA